MSDLSKHTETPWQVVENDGAYVKHAEMAKLRIETAEASGRDVCVGLVITDIPELDNQANAAFIVRAVNCHDELVAALKLALSMLPKRDAALANYPLYAQIEDAITRAESL